MEDVYSPISLAFFSTGVMGFNEALAVCNDTICTCSFLDNSSI